MVQRLAVLLTLAAALVGASAAGAATVAIDGPSADLPDGQEVSVAVARDGTAAIAYLRKVGGVDHVFVARRQGDGWGSPERVDTGLVAPSTSPVVGAADGGKVVVAFPNGTAGNERLYAASASAAGAVFAAPVTVQGDTPGWKGVALALGDNGDGYLVAYEGFNLWAFRLAGGSWSPVGAGFPSGDKLNVSPTDQAEHGDQRGARIAVTRDGTAATVAWTETGIGEFRMVARRLTGAQAGDIGPGVLANATALGAEPGAFDSSDMGDVAVDGSGRAWVAFRQAFDYGAQNFSRAIARSFDGAAFGEPQALDGLPLPPAESAEYPRLAVNASGAGLAVPYRQLTFTTEAAVLSNGAWTRGTTVSQEASDAPGRATAALADTGAGVVAYVRSPGGGADRQILGRVWTGSAFGPVETLSNPAFGTAATAKDSGASAAFAATAFVQGTGASARIVAATTPLPQPATPGAGTPTGPTATPDTTAPRITQLRVTPSAFRTGAKPGQIRLAATPSPAAVRLTLSESAMVRFSAERLVAGRRSGRRCVKPTRRNRGARRCVLVVPGRDAVLLELPTGTSRLRFAGRLGRRLPPGAHRLVATPTDGAGNRGAARRASFTILPPKRR